MSVKKLEFEEHACEARGRPLPKEKGTRASMWRGWFMGKCPDCGDSVILYASWAHYVMGDY